MHFPTAIIAEDEVLLAENLRQELAQCWPELSVVAVASHGAAAVDATLLHRPDVCFFDIRMPGMSGLEAAAALVEDWPDGKNFPLLVFVTAYEQYAVHAFEHAAIDYIVKPMQAERLAQTCTRLRAALALRAQEEHSLSGLQIEVQKMAKQLRQVWDEGILRSLKMGEQMNPPLRLLQVAKGNTILMVPIDEILYFEAADKYVRVIVPGKEYLIRISLRELMLQLDMQRFWQIHRSLLVRSDAIECAIKDELGKVVLHLHGSSDRLQVSRMFAYLFKGV
jgi:DNA-binding LytR/AlgR family response regulator